MPEIGDYTVFQYFGPNDYRPVAPPSSWGAAGGGGKIALLADVKSAGTNGGGVTGSYWGGGWAQRDLNTLLADPSDLLEDEEAEEVGAGKFWLDSNAIELGVGRWIIRAEVPAYGVQFHVARIYDVTADEQVGKPSAVGLTPNLDTTNTSFVSVEALVTVISGSKVVRVEHLCHDSRATIGMGISGPGAGAGGGAALWAAVEAVFTRVRLELVSSLA
jgi:hypothetical protein